MIKRERKHLKLFLMLAIILSCLFLLFLGVITFLYNKYYLDVNKLTSVNNGIKVYSATGNDSTLYNTNRSIIEIEDLPPHVKNAFIAIEDKNFYSHKGYDLKRILKSTYINFTSQSKSQGASTISQQLIKNALLSNEKTYSRKIQEIILSIKMEKKFSKDDILEMYLNTIYFGSNAYGIENASKTFFNKSAKDLTINEACCLAGLIKSPKTYSPIYNYSNSIKRKNLVAQYMFKQNKISKSEYEEVINSKIETIYEQENKNCYEKEAIHEACMLLNITERQLINSQYEIITFKQDDLQAKIQDINNTVILNAETNTNSNLDSLTVVTNNTGHVLAYYANSNYDLHDLKRQPASTLKPFAVYLPCFKHNILSPASMVLDEEINYNGFSPQNADKKFHGYVSVRDALANSLNVPAVKALDYLGLKKSKETLTNFGINIANSDMNLSLALGAVKNGVKLMDLLAAYNTLANNGYYYNLCFVNKILDNRGNIIYSHENYGSFAMDPESCFLTTDILLDSAKYGTAKRLESLNLPVASKTGTASTNLGNTDLYNFAYTSEHSMFTWIANVDDKILDSTLLSAAQPTEINKQILSYIYNNCKPSNFEVPEGVVRCGFDINEQTYNHIIVEPNHNVDRYIDYDYFKLENRPKKLEKSNDIGFNVSIDKSGVTISFNAKIFNDYYVYKETNKAKALLKLIDNKDGIVVIKDNEVFNYEYINYFISDSDDNLLGEVIQIKPKEFIINLLNNEVLFNKKKWAV